MAKPRRNSTREFKAEAVGRIAAYGNSPPEVARQPGLGESLLRSWKVALAAQGEQALSWQRQSPGR